MSLRGPVGPAAARAGGGSPAAGGRAAPGGVDLDAQIDDLEDAVGEDPDLDDDLDDLDELDEDEADDAAAGRPGTAADGRVSLLDRAFRIRHDNRFIFSTMLMSALISLLASFVLSVDAIVLAANPDAVLACDVSATLSCGAVAQSWQASLFGFPNAFLGLIAEPVVITIAVASLGGVRFPRWFMASAQLVYTLGLIFAYWLFTQSMFVIGALCPWCLLVTVSTTLVFTTLTHVNVRDDNLYLPRAVQAKARWAIEHEVDVIVVWVWLLGLAALIAVRYGPALLG